MPHEIAKLTGKVTDVFGHRFVVDTGRKRILADIGPKAAQHVALEIGTRVELTGEWKPGELKVHRISIDGGAQVDAHHAKHEHKAHDDHHDDHGGVFTADHARRIAERQGFEIIGDLKAHKKHYEASVTQNGVRHDIHVHRDHVMVKHKVA